MQDQYKRTIDYLRISITDRCNLRCTYCMPAEGIEAIPHKEILTFEEIVKICRVFASMGVKHMKVTGGEPLVRRDADILVREIKAIPGVETVTLTTNGTLLPLFMEKLADAGIDGINISLDTLDEQKFREITRVGNLSEVLDGIHAAILYKQVVIKINCVLDREGWQERAVSVASLAKTYPVHVRFIERMPLTEAGIIEETQEEQVKAVLEHVYGKMERYQGVLGPGPSVYYSLDGFQGKIGFISAISHKFCEKCNRVRLTCDGMLRMCLQSKDGMNLKKILREQESEEALQAAIAQALFRKPKEHQFHDLQIQAEGMAQIGG